MKSKKIAALILAAGPSSRLGSPKQLLNYKGKTLLENTINSALNSHCFPVVVVVGASKEKIIPVIENYPIELIENKEWEMGMGSSIKAGVEFIKKNYKVDALIIMVCDQPFVSSSLLESLVQSSLPAHCDIVATSYDNTIGVPALFKKNIFDVLTLLKGNEGAKKVILANGKVEIIQFPDGNIDIDTKEDYFKL